MTFSKEQIAELEKPLAREFVKSRSQGGRALSYIEGWHAISEANRIFGFGGWERVTDDIKQLGTPYKNQNGNTVINYSAKVKIVVTGGEFGGGVVRDGCGFGQGIDKDEGKAHESAIKEAETDAMKRALMTFGNQFGLALYDKEQNGVGDAINPKQEFLKSLTTTIEKATSAETLGTWWNSEEQKTSRKDFGLSLNEGAQFKNMVIEKISQLKKEKAA